MARSRLQRVLVAAGAVAATGWAAYRLAEGRLRPEQPQLALARGNRLLRQGRRVLVATGRWEDLEFLLGGTLRLLAQAGSDLTIAGPGPMPADPTWSRLATPHALLPEELPSDQTYSPAVQRALKQLWWDVQPELVLTFDPDFPVRLWYHPAHGLVGHAVLDLVLAGAVPGAQVLTFATRRPNVVLDIGPVLAAKLAALAQGSGPLHRVRLQQAAARLWARLYGRGAGLPYAEGLRALQPHTGSPMGPAAAAPAAYDGAGAGQDMFPG